MHPFRVLNFIVSLGLFIYFWVTISDAMDNAFIGFLLAIGASAMLSLVIGVILAIVVNAFGGSNDNYSSYAYSWRSKAIKQANATVAPPPTAASQQSWEDRMKGGAALPPPE